MKSDAITSILFLSSTLIFHITFTFYFLNQIILHIFSETFFDDYKRRFLFCTTIVDRISSLLKQIIDFYFSFTDASQTMVKRWKFSHPNTIFPEPYVEVDSGLFLAGDSFGGPSVTGAFLSAEKLASHLLTDEK